mmetsp:Transcript_32621/g.77380  ORF Transcript_32621/g.77380 Transcript_32621/m.77380 type:complete len:204 (-) Transcript_32621:861-1472(-)
MSNNSFQPSLHQLCRAWSRPGNKDKFDVLSTKQVGGENSQSGLLDLLETGSKTKRGSQDVDCQGALPRDERRTNLLRSGQGLSQIRTLAEDFLACPLCGTEVAKSELPNHVEQELADWDASAAQVSSSSCSSRGRGVSKPGVPVCGQPEGPNSRKRKHGRGAPDNSRQRGEPVWGRWLRRHSRSSCHTVGFCCGVQRGVLWRG